MNPSPLCLFCRIMKKTGKKNGIVGNVLFSLYFNMASESTRIQVRQNEVKGHDCADILTRIILSFCF